MGPHRVAWNVVEVSSCISMIWCWNDSVNELCAKYLRTGASAWQVACVGNRIPLFDVKQLDLTHDPMPDLTKIRMLMQIARSVQSRQRYSPLRMTTRPCNCWQCITFKSCAGTAPTFRYWKQSNKNIFWTLKIQNLTQHQTFWNTLCAC